MQFVDLINAVEACMKYGLHFNVWQLWFDIMFHKNRLE